jgi:protein tyrosine phosphatase (PTP) superfamily phosphohydrolase (DUF442 family)
VLLTVAAAAVAGCNVGPGAKWAFLAGREAPAVDQRPGYWAKPLASEGIANFYQVSPVLYRGSEPTREGMEQLARMGVKTVVNMRSWGGPHDTSSRMDGLPLRYVQIEMKAWEPQDQYTLQFLRIVTDPSRQPVFLHCYTGGDRAGLMVAVYRVVVQGWSKDEALAEMRGGGYTYHEIFDRWYPQYVQNMDVAQMRRLAGLADRPADRFAGNGRGTPAGGTATGGGTAATPQYQPNGVVSRPQRPLPIP